MPKGMGFLAGENMTPADRKRRLERTERRLKRKADEGWKDIGRGKAKRMTKEQFLKELATW